MPQTCLSPKPFPLQSRGGPYIINLTHAANEVIDGELRSRSAVYRQVGVLEGIHVREQSILALVSLKHSSHCGRRCIRKHRVDQEALSTTLLQSNSGANRRNLESSEPDQFPGPQRLTSAPGTIDSMIGTPF